MLNTQPSCALGSSQHLLLAMRYAILDVPEDTKLSRKTTQLSPVNMRSHKRLVLGFIYYVVGFFCISK